MVSNYQIIQTLLDERNTLEGILKKAGEEIRKAPEGTVQVKKHHRTLQFYYRKDPHERDGVYLRTADREKGVQLIQKAYLEDVCRVVKEQLKAVNHFLNKFDPDAVKKVYASVSQNRLSFLKPIDVPDDIFAAAWQETQYEHKGFPEDLQEHYTQKGERVRSKSEVLIADSLCQARIPYLYEFPLEVNFRTFHPDFTILRPNDRKILYWEHFGMMDDLEYSENAFRKIREYITDGIFPGDNLIITVETSNIALNRIIIDQTIRHYILQK